VRSYAKVDKIGCDSKIEKAAGKSLHFEMFEIDKPSTEPESIVFSIVVGLQIREVEVICAQMSIFGPSNWLQAGGPSKNPAS
jgi:hypothetical protein